MDDPRVVARLNRLVNWYRVEGDKVQIVAPNGDSVTISNAEDFVPVLRELSAGISQFVKDDGTGELFEVLFRMGCLVDGYEDENSTYFSQYAQFCSKLINSKHPHPISPPTEVKIVGKGGLADMFAKRYDARSATTRGTLIVAMGDWEDSDFFRDETQTALKLGCSIVSIRWVENRLFVGPLVIQGDGPCYDCYFHRSAASAAYVAEFHAQTSQAPISPVVRTEDEIIRSFVSYVVERQIALILTGAFDQAAYASVERWDPYTGRVDKGKIHKIPMCATCGGAKIHDPVAAVRDLI